MSHRRSILLGITLCLFWVSTARAQGVSFVNFSADATSNFATSLTLNMPASIQSGDCLIADLQLNACSQSFTPPAGNAGGTWALISGSNTGVGACVASISYSLYYNGTAPNLIWSWTPNGAGIHGHILAFRGVDQTSCIDGTIGVALDNNTGGGVTAVQKTPSVSGDMLLLLYGAGANLADITVTGSPTLTTQYTLSSNNVQANAYTLALTDTTTTTAYSVSKNNVYEMLRTYLVKAALATPTPTPTPTPFVPPPPTPVPSPTRVSCLSVLPACVLVSHGAAFRPTPSSLQAPQTYLEQPPPWLPGYRNNYECCSVVYPGRLCQWNSNICYYIDPY